MTEQQKYRDMVQEYLTKKAELQKLAADLVRQRSVAGLEEEKLPFAFAETPEKGVIT